MGAGSFEPIGLASGFLANGLICGLEAEAPSLTPLLLFDLELIFPEAVYLDFLHQMVDACIELYFADPAVEECI